MKKWIKLIFVILTFALISTAIYFILKIFNLTDLNKIKYLILSAGQIGILVYGTLLTLCLIVLCFIPLLNTGFIILGLYIFGPITTFITCIIANFISTSILFLIGDKLGESFARKLIGKETFEQTQNLIDNKAKIMLPILFIIPAVPDEAISLVAGITKIKYWYLITVSLIYHTLELGFFCLLGSELIAWSSLSYFDWIILVNIIIIDVYFLLKLEKTVKKQ